MKTLTAATIAEVIQGRIIQGSGERVIVSVAKLNEATMADLGFFSNPKYESQVYESACGTIIVPEDFTPTNGSYPNRS